MTSVLKKNSIGSSILNEDVTIIQSVRSTYNTKDISIVGDTMFVDFGQCDMMMNIKTFCTYILYQSLNIKDLFTLDELIDEQLLNNNHTIAEKVLFVLNNIFNKINEKNNKISQKIKEIEKDLIYYKNKNDIKYLEYKRKIDNEKIQLRKDEVFLKNIKK